MSYHHRRNHGMFSTGNAAYLGNLYEIDRFRRKTPHEREKYLLTTSSALDGDNSNNGTDNDKSNSPATNHDSLTTPFSLTPSDTTSQRPLLAADDRQTRGNDDNGEDEAEAEDNFISIRRSTRFTKPSTREFAFGTIISPSTQSVSARASECTAVVQLSPHAATAGLPSTRVGGSSSSKTRFDDQNEEQQHGDVDKSGRVNLESSADFEEKENDTENDTRARIKAYDEELSVSTTFNFSLLSTTSSSNNLNLAPGGSNKYYQNSTATTTNTLSTEAAEGTLTREGDDINNYDSEKTTIAANFDLSSIGSIASDELLDDEDELDSGLQTCASSMQISPRSPSSCVLATKEDGSFYDFDTSKIPRATDRRDSAAVIISRIGSNQEDSSSGDRSREPASAQQLIRGQRIEHHHPTELRLHNTSTSSTSSRNSSSDSSTTTTFSFNTATADESSSSSSRSSSVQQNSSSSRYQTPPSEEDAFDDNEPTDNHNNNDDGPDENEEKEANDDSGSGSSLPIRVSETEYIPCFSWPETSTNNNAAADQTIKIDENQNFSYYYEEHEEIGLGKFGRVHRCVQKGTEREFAGKFVKTKTLKARREVDSEIEILQSLQHSKIAKLHQAFYSSPNNEVILIMDRIEGGELFERVVEEEFLLTETAAVMIMRQLCEATLYIHSKSIVHLDLKPENILFTSRRGNRIKLVDFGLAQRLNPDESAQQRVMAGTAEFISPEVVNYDDVSLKTDMWSIGVICYVLVSGCSPFLGDSNIETYVNVTRGEWEFDEEGFEDVSSAAKDFITRLIVMKKEKRMSAEECLHHRWLKSKPPRASPSKPIKSDVEKCLSTERLRKYLIRRKWRKAIHAIQAVHRIRKQAKTQNENDDTTNYRRRRQLSPTTLPSSENAMILRRNNSRSKKDSTRLIGGDHYLNNNNSTTTRGAYDHNILRGRNPPTSQQTAMSDPEDQGSTFSEDFRISSSEEENESDHQHSINNKDPTSLAAEEENENEMFSDLKPTTGNGTAPFSDFDNAWMYSANFDDGDDGEED